MVLLYREVVKPYPCRIGPTDTNRARLRLVSAGVAEEVIVQALENFQLGYIRAMAKCGRPLEDAFLEAVGSDMVVEAERIWQRERAETEKLKQQSSPSTSNPRVHRVDLPVGVV